MLDLSIIVVSYNTKDLTYKCISSIIKNMPAKINYEIIVVDNASKDKSVEQILSFNISRQRRGSPKAANLKVIKNKTNLGFAKANNQGIKISDGEFILLLNSDSVVLDQSLEKMVQFIRQHPKAGVVGGKLINEDGSDQPSTGSFLGVWQTILWLFGGERIGLLRSSPAEVCETDWVSGALLMVRRKIIKRVGLLDENFFMYLEEMEWCYRIKKKGYAVYFLPEAKVLHKKLGSGNRSLAILNIYNGLVYFYKKHKSPFELWIVLVFLKIKALIAALLGYKFNNAYLKNTYGKALAIS